MSGVSNDFELKWTASVEATLHDGVDYLWHKLFVVMDEALRKRAPVYSTTHGESSLTTTIGVEDTEVEDAKLHSEDLIKEALGRAGVQWLEVSCSRITPNRELMEEIDQLRVFGSPDQTAKILPLVKPETD